MLFLWVAPSLLGSGLWYWVLCPVSCNGMSVGIFGSPPSSVSGCGVVRSVVVFLLSGVPVVSLSFPVVLLPVWFPGLCVAAAARITIVGLLGLVVVGVMMSSVPLRAGVSSSLPVAFVRVREVIFSLSW